MSTDVRRLREEVRQLKSELDDTRKAFHDLESVTLRYLALTRQMGLPDNMRRGIAIMQRTIIVARQLETTIMMTRAALAGAGPLGWLMLGAAAITTFATASELVTDVIE